MHLRGVATPMIIANKPYYHHHHHHIELTLNLLISAQI